MYRTKSRDYWTRTSDLAPPRRVRYQLRQIPNTVLKQLQRYIFYRDLPNLSAIFYFLTLNIKHSKRLHGKNVRHTQFSCRLQMQIARGVHVMCTKCSRCMHKACMIIAQKPNAASTNVVFIVLHFLLYQTNA